jgi:hypothetical protein
MRRSLQAYRIAAVALACVATPLRASAQVLPTPVPSLDSIALGGRVRVVLNTGERRQGAILTRDSLSFVLVRPVHVRRPHAPDSTWFIARDSVHAMWLDVGGHTRSGMRHGAVVGAVVGAVGGCVVGFIPEDHACQILAPVGLVLGAVAGAGVGAAVGSGVRVWVAVRW